MRIGTLLIGVCDPSAPPFCLQGHILIYSRMGPVLISTTCPSGILAIAHMRGSGFPTSPLCFSFCLSSYFGSLSQGLQILVLKDSYLAVRFLHQVLHCCLCAVASISNRSRSSCLFLFGPSPSVTFILFVLIHVLLFQSIVEVLYN